MKTLTILADFDAYPSNTNLRSFREGEEVEVSDAFGAIVVEKGLAREAAPAASKSTPAKAKETDA